MSNTKSVVIDGVIYVPAIGAIPTIDTIMQALYEQYMGDGKRWNEDSYTAHLNILVSEDDEGGDTFEQFIARIAGLLGSEAQS